MKHQAAVVTLLQLDVSVQRHAHPQRADFPAPGVLRQGLLGGGAGQRVSHALEGDHKAFSSLIELIAAKAAEQPPQQRVVTGQRGRERLARPLPVGRRALNVRQEKGYRAGR